MKLKLIHKLILLMIAFPVTAQPGSLDNTFSTGTGFNISVAVTTLQQDGKILAGGSFTSFNGTPANRIIRLNTDGSLDTTFSAGTGMNHVVYSIREQPDEKIIVVGWFTSYNGHTANYILRLNTDGSIDSTFNVGSGFNYRVETIGIQQDGKILLGGDFSSYNGITSHNIVRLNPDGSFDSTFITGTGFSNNWTKSISIQQDGKIIVGGHFTSYNGTTTNYIARLNSDGSIDPTFDTGTGFNGIVMITAIQADGKIIAGGDFTSYNGINANRIIRLNSDGSPDTSFNPGTGFNDRPRTISVQQNGRMVIGGTFTEFNGTTANLITRLNSDGSQDTTFQTGTGFTNTGALVSLLSSAIQQDGQIIVGGTFVEYNGTAIGRIAKLNGDCIVDETTDTIFACSEYTWIDGITYSNSDYSAAFMLANSVGCDSIIRLHLTIETIDTDVTQNGILLSSNQIGANYQWIDCSSMQEIPGATEQSFTATANGSYAVVITMNTCSDTSYCYSISTIDIEEIRNQTQWWVFPNPAGEHFSIHTLNDGLFEIFDYSGKLIATYHFPPGSNMINEKFSSGLYFIRERRSQMLQKIIIE